MPFMQLVQSRTAHTAMGISYVRIAAQKGDRQQHAPDEFNNQRPDVGAKAVGLSTFSSSATRTCNCYVILVSVYMSGSPAARCMISNISTVIIVGSTTLVMGVKAIPMITSEAMSTKTVLAR